jgi:hypothetical protein
MFYSTKHILSTSTGVQGNYVICLQYLRQMRPINFQPGFLLSIICTPSPAVGFRQTLKDNVQMNYGKEEPPIKCQLFQCYQ